MIKGQYEVRLADGAAALALRAMVFRAGLASDADRFDALCSHLVVLKDGVVVACARLLALGEGCISDSYSAQYYDLSRLTAFPGPVLELGRFCLHPDHPDPDILRLMWAALTQIVDDGGITFMFGCTSFPGTDPIPHHAAFAGLSRYLAPAQWRPVKLPIERHDLPADAPYPATLPPLLRSYLQLGAWVSDHAVVDRDLNTLHVFTGLEVARIPQARARVLRALSQT